MSYNKADFRATIDGAVGERDVKKITGLMQTALRMAGPHLATVKCVNNTLASLTSYRRNWDEIKAEAYHVSNSLEEAFDKEAADGCISHGSKEREATLAVRCEQAKVLFGDIPLSALHDNPDKARDALESVASYVQDMLNIVNS